MSIPGAELLLGKEALVFWPRFLEEGDCLHTVCDHLHSRIDVHRVKQTSCTKNTLRFHLTIFNSSEKDLKGPNICYCSAEGQQYE